MLVGRQFQEDFIDELLSDAKPEAFPELGERAWKWTGKHGILYTLDAGNGWHIVMKCKNSHESPKLLAVLHLSRVDLPDPPEGVRLPG